MVWWGPHGRDGRRTGRRIRPLPVPFYCGRRANKVVLRIAVLEKRDETKKTWEQAFAVNDSVFSDGRAISKLDRCIYLFVKAAQVSVLPHAVQHLRCRFHHFRTMSGNSAERRKTRENKASLTFVIRGAGWTIEIIICAAHPTIFNWPYWSQEMPSSFVDPIILDDLIGHTVGCKQKKSGLLSLFSFIWKFTVTPGLCTNWYWFQRVANWPLKTNTRTGHRVPEMRGSDFQLKRKRFLWDDTGRWRYVWLRSVKTAFKKYNKDKTPQNCAFSFWKVHNVNSFECHWRTWTQMANGDFGCESKLYMTHSSS